ncbi:Holin of 3TMs, for gene-transfer release [uncultured Caudovirales phage]|uniref:Holin of 3TMs, for gene-transfer release n=1 Tax=uncultured Caudovirales phage TaxID=2100421 RepID=A0A6J7W6I1_9CAUD|nr:Holin of 3TMs, for gene-transfer release [uncultured Caudovirales phage]
MFGIDDVIGIGMKLVDKLIPDPAQKAQAQLDLAKLAQEGKLADVQADMNEMQEITKRWEADMASDSWLSKNIRPMALIAIFAAYFIFTTMSAFGKDANQAYVQLLGQWGQIVFLAYFGGRTAEKIMEMKWGKKNDQQ